MSSTAMREWRRHRAWALKEVGWEQKAIAAALGVTQGAVSQWIKRAREQGPETLAAGAHRGVPSKLTAEQKAGLIPLLQQGAEAQGYAGDVWTLARVADVVLRTYGVRYHPSTMTDLLREIGWTAQQPVQRAQQRDEAAIAVWQKEQWPAIKKKPRTRPPP